MGARDASHGRACDGDRGDRSSHRAVSCWWPAAPRHTVAADEPATNPHQHRGATIVGKIVNTDPPPVMHPGRQEPAMTAAEHRADVLHHHDQPHHHIFEHLENPHLSQMQTDRHIVRHETPPSDSAWLCTSDLEGSQLIAKPFQAPRSHALPTIPRSLSYNAGTISSPSVGQGSPVCAIQSALAREVRRVRSRL